jgi:hypothetical protein
VGTLKETGEKECGSNDRFFAFPLRLSRLLRDKCVKSPRVFAPWRLNQENLPYGDFEARPADNVYMV